MKKIAALIGLATTTILFPISTLAATIVFDNHIGKVYIKNVEVRNIGNAMSYSINIRTPSCPNQYHVKGWVQLTYTATNGGWFRTKAHTFEGSDEENIDRTFSDIMNYNMSDNGGRARITTDTQCVYHGIRRGGVRLPF